MSTQSKLFPLFACPDRLLPLIVSMAAVLDPGGQYTSPATDRLSDVDEERIAWASFEAERQALAGAVADAPS